MAKHSVNIIKMRCWLGQNKELTTIGVRSLISHRQQEWDIMLQIKILISKLSTVNTLSTFTISIREVPRLHHEVFHHPVEGGALVVQGLASGFP